MSDLVSQYRSGKKSFHAADLKAMMSDQQRRDATQKFRYETQPALEALLTESCMWQVGPHLARGKTVMDLIHHAVFIHMRMGGVMITECDVDIYRDHVYVKGRYSPVATLSRSTDTGYGFEFAAYPVQ